MRSQVRAHGTASQGQRIWPVLLLLLAAVVVPTACVLWFMSQAMRNERIAVRHELTRVYSGHLAGIRSQVLDEWNRRIIELGKLTPDSPAAASFADVVTRGICDSLILRDRAGTLRYPMRNPKLPQTPEPAGDDWNHARELEHEQRNPAAAAEAYGQIAKTADDVNIAALSLQAQARCLAKAGQTDAALSVLTQTLTDPRYASAVDSSGRLIAAAAQLQALQMQIESSSQSSPILDALRRRVSDYHDPAMPRSQRLFIMQQLRVLAPSAPPLPTLAAEDLADTYAATLPESSATRAVFPLLLSEAWSAAPDKDRPPNLRPSPIKGVWQLELPRGIGTALYQQTGIIAHAQSLIRSRGLLSEATVELVPPTEQGSTREPLQTLMVSDLMPEWRLNAYLDESGAISQAAARQTTMYLWTAILGIVIIAILALLVAGYVTRQMKLTRLKNDLIATVSHELRTPLASTRALVETLLEGRYHDQQQVHEYLQLIAKENARLSRLIDNFLTFSRMERNKRTFEQSSVRPEEIIAAAAEVMSERFAAPGCLLETQVEPNLPTITGDRDALITVLLNLLENAHKYSGEGKHVTLQAAADGDHIRIDVKDNGIGIPRRAMRKIFDRFYQVDQSLSRKTGGCGLGLSIVRFIIEAHSGTISVDSKPEEGSTFTVRLPIEERMKAEG